MKTSVMLKRSHSKSPSSKSFHTDSFSWITFQSWTVSSFLIIFSNYFHIFQMYLFIYLLPSCSHSWAQQPFHQFFLQSDGIHPKPLWDRQTKIAAGSRTSKNTPAGNGKEQIWSEETWINSVCVSVPKLSTARLSCSCSTDLLPFFFPCLLFVFLWFTAIWLSLFRQVWRNSQGEGGKWRDGARERW